jgi:hypothetical protein
MELYDASTGALLNSSPYTAISRGFQSTTSHGNRISLIGKGGRDIGGSFTTQGSTIDSGRRWINLSITGGGLTRTHVGPIFAWSSNDQKSSSGLVPPSSQLALQGYGVTGVARALPTNPLSGMGQFLAELRDLPKAPLQEWKGSAKDFKSLARNGSSEYLNVQFGWVPFVKDLKDFVKVTRNLSENVRNFANNSGQNVRRGSTVFSDSSTTTSLVTNNWNGSPAINSSFIVSSGKLYKTVTTKTHIYFKGAFTYYLPTKGEKALAKLIYYERLAHKLYGLRVDPDLLWKIAPWSWAADWIGNIGDNVHNWSAFQNDDLVMRYGYLMEEKSTITTYAGTDLRLKNGDVVSLTQTYTDSVKSRIQATPYGFGLNPSSFSAKQWSIIGALGISQGPRLLNK